jgi:outer membrane protein
MKNQILIFVFVFFSHSIIFAQDTIRLNFDEVVKIALTKNIQLRQEQNNLKYAVAVKNQGIANFVPNVNAETDYNHISGLQFDQITGSLYSSSSDYMQGNITATYTIFNGLGRYNTLKNANKMMDSQIDNVRRTEQLTIFNVGQQFLQVLLDREILRIAIENIKNQKTTLKQIEGFVEAGTRPLSDKLNQEAEVKRLEVIKIRAENKLRLDRAFLSQTLLMDAGTEVDPLEPAWSFESILSEKNDINELYKVALGNRPDYKKSLNDQDAARAALGMARSYFYPSLGVFYRYGSSYSSFALDPQNNELIPFRDQFLRNNKQSIYGFQLSIPIFQQFRTITQNSRAKVTMENTNLAADNLKITIFREVQNAYLGMDAARNEYFATQAQYEAAQEANKIQNERYVVGVGDLVELSQSVQRFVEAAASRANAQYTLLFQKVILDYYTGILNAENLH